MNALCIPGLESNHRLFSLLTAELGGAVADWITPEKEESLEAYCLRYSQKLKLQINSQVCLVGFCFGGVIAKELAEHLEPGAIVTINAPGCPKDISEDFRKGVAYGTKLPISILKGLLKTHSSKYFCSKENLTDSQAAEVTAMLNELDLDFLTWAAKASAGWKRERPYTSTIPTLALYGEENQIIKPPKTVPFEVYPGQGHLIPLTDPLGLSYRIRQFWKNIPNS